ncbi:MAG: TIGR01906 family membrane protein [Clostridia bacterium]|nr:TIGR01906 family membrane protein [Clostridia bacterium]
MRKWLVVTAAIVFSLMLALHMLLSFIMLVGMDEELYKKAQVADEIHSYAGISQETLDRATVGLIDYMDGRRDDLIILSEPGTGYELFNAREKSHMADVKNLFALAKRINFGLFITIVFLLIFCLAYDKEGMKKYFMKYCAITLAVILSAWIIIAVLALIDFTAFWTAFHKLFFTNDLWLLDPSTDLLIRMMPQRFFIRILSEILWRFMVSYILVMGLLASSHMLLNRTKRNKDK